MVYTKSVQVQDDPSIPLRDVRSRAHVHLPTGVRALDRLLGGGLVAGKFVILAGSEDAGKSTLLLQAAGGLAQAVTTLYVSGEEDREEIKLRAERLGLGLPPRFRLGTEATVDAIEDTLARRPVRAILVDSLNRITVHDDGAAAGSPGDLKACAAALMALARASRTAVVAVCHLNTENQVAGSRGIRYDADAILMLEKEGGETSWRRLVARKNRLGPRVEPQRIEMTAQGLR